LKKAKIYDIIMVHIRKELFFMKSKISIILALVTVLLCFAACSNIPDEPATTAVEYYSYNDPYVEVAPPANVSEGAEYTQKYVDKNVNIEFVMSSYYADGNTAAKITKIDFMSPDMVMDMRGLATIEIIGKSRSQEYMRIAYTAYDANGKVLRNTFLQGKLEGVGNGERCAPAPFEIPDGTVKIVFSDYVEE